MARTWFITGVSSGFGRGLAEAALARGDSVAGTVRQQSQAAEFETLAPGRAHGILLDVTDRKAIPAAVASGIERLGGKLDILVNNAGFGMFGALEELDEDQIDDAIDANFHGTVFVTRAALPAIRASRGSIVNMSSAVGYYGLAGNSAYCAAKFAVEGLSEALRAELAPLGVQVMLVEPGFFHTNFATTSIKAARTAMDAYDQTPVGETRRGNPPFRFTPNQPEDLVALVLDTIDSGNLPPRLVIGEDAMEMLRIKIASLQDTYEACQAFTVNRPAPTV